MNMPGPVLMPNAPVMHGPPLPIPVPPQQPQQHQVPVAFPMPNPGAGHVGQIPLPPLTNGGGGGGVALPPLINGPLPPLGGGGEQQRPTANPGNGGGTFPLPPLINGNNGGGAGLPPLINARLPQFNGGGGGGGGGGGQTRPPPNAGGGGGGGGGGGLPPLPPGAALPPLPFQQPQIVDIRPLPSNVGSVCAPPIGSFPTVLPPSIPKPAPLPNPATSPPPVLNPKFPPLVLVLAFVAFLMLIAEVDTMSRYLGSTTTRYTGKTGGMALQKLIVFGSIAGGIGVLIFVAYHPSPSPLPPHTKISPIPCL